MTGHENPGVAPLPTQSLAAKWVAMRLKSGKAVDSFWPSAAAQQQTFTGHRDLQGFALSTSPLRRFRLSAALEEASLPPPRQPRDKPRLAEPLHHVFQMHPVARFDHDFEQGALGRQVGERTLVRDLDDVGAGFGGERRDGGELARAVDDVEGDLGQPALARELARQHRSYQHRIDVAAGQHETDIATGKTLPRR